MNRPEMIELDYDWLDEDEDDCEGDDGLGDLYYKDATTGLYTRIDTIHLAHFIALYEREEDYLN